MRVAGRVRCRRPYLGIGECDKRVWEEAFHGHPRGNTVYSHVHFCLRLREGERTGEGQCATRRGVPDWNSELLGRRPRS